MSNIALLTTDDAVSDGPCIRWSLYCFVEWEPKGSSRFDSFDIFLAFNIGCRVRDLRAAVYARRRPVLSSLLAVFWTLVALFRFSAASLEALSVGLALDTNSNYLLLILPSSQTSLTMQQRKAMSQEERQGNVAAMKWNMAFKKGIRKARKQLNEENRKDEHSVQKVKDSGAVFWVLSAVFFLTVYGVVKYFFMFPYKPLVTVFLCSGAAFSVYQLSQTMTDLGLGEYDEDDDDENDSGNSETAKNR